MLVLTRKKDEAIFIGNEIKIVVCKIRDDRVRIGIEAPRELKILRDEHVERRNDK